ncbi:ABC transporter ATP-binding protein [Cellulosilyticum sp. ST5]|uniref:ABC transporter ATP-binding protein n=1 Tax=Cellulosilyticum sp. ST5 TaxID=3055805 RepID=UPI003977A48A
MEPIIQVKDLKKIYKMGNEEIPALNGISLAIEPEAIYCLYGTSGSGKSTLLNMLAGLEKPTEGTIYIKGKAIHKMNEIALAKFRQKYIGFVFQSYNLIPSLTALENVTLPLIFQGVPKKARETRAAEMLAAVGLSHRMRHKPCEMSGGQQQRVSIARAFVNKPTILFADEPTGNLDTTTTLEVMDIMTSVARDYHQTLIIVSHDLEIADYANKIVTIKNGEIENIKVNKPEERIVSHA